MSSVALHDQKARYSAVDSLLCKYSASSLKYFHNPYILNIYNKLIKDTNIDTTKATRRSPIIHRGYYTRNESFTNILKQFLNTISLSNNDDNKEFTSQIIYLGPGFDTISLIPFLESSNASKLKTFEIDYPEIINKKIDFYSSDEDIMTILTNASSSKINNNNNININTNINTVIKSLSPNLTLIGHDLRDTQSIISILKQSDFDCNLPTLILSECVLVYIEKEYILNLCNEFSKCLLATNSIWVTYDMINPFDMYGKHMIKNLEAVGFSIPGIKDFPTLSNQCSRFNETGWDQVHSCTMRYYYDNLILIEEKLRIQKLELLDEVEEWNLLMEHYSFTIAIKGPLFIHILNTIPPTSL